MQLLQCMISFTTGMSGGIGGGTIPKPGIIGVIGGIPVIIPSAGSKSEKGEKKINDSRQGQMEAECYVINIKSKGLCKTKAKQANAFSWLTFSVLITMQLYTFLS